MEMTHKTSCALCSINCGLEVLVEDNRIVKARPDKDNPRSQGYACRKGLNIAFHQHNADRLTHPLKRTGSKFEKISWEQAIGEIAERLRVFVDADKLEAWPELKTWFFKLKTKKEQDADLLSTQIKEAGSGICGMHKVEVAERFIKRRPRGSLAICPKCREGYPLDDGPLCSACSGKEILYLSLIRK